jgi:hypothetical protein
MYAPPIKPQGKGTGELRWALACWMLIAEN